LAENNYTEHLEDWKGMGRTKYHTESGEQSEAKPENEEERDKILECFMREK
jgi:hypothetical protein